ncbi:MAG: CRISPR-associated endonuclease Cas1 [Acidobacteriia bacterium]|nr:CRISPR-associated endonuclease Cas1 [Terriglobia bacterium]
MAASPTVPQSLQHCNFVPILLRQGVITLFGYGIKVHVDRGHLTIQDGIGAARRETRLPRIGHGLRRLVVIGSDGLVSLAALRWLADQDAAFVMLDRIGKVLVTTGPVRPSDARLRRAQSLAHQSGSAFRIAQELIGHKLAGQEQLVRNRLKNEAAAQTISGLIVALSKAKTFQDIRLFESHAAATYWTAWHHLPITYPRKDLPRISEHWRVFNARKSPLSGSPRLAVNPPNAMLNYLYALLESEASLALSALGLDPGVGVLHVDTPARASLACDLMEAVRPKVDAFVLDWITQEPLRREWFFEQRDGSCRLMGSFAARLSETTAMWRQHVAPFAERISHILWSTIQKPSRHSHPPTRLTQGRRRQVKGGSFDLPDEPTPRTSAVCRICGVEIKFGDKYCRTCAITASKENLVEAAKSGRAATVSAKAQALRSTTQRRQAAALRAWNPSDKPDWLDERVYCEKIQPRLAKVTVPTILAALHVSEPYATNIRAGRCIPHPRHWLTLAALVKISAS